MTDFDKIKYGFIFSAIGTVLGWTLNQTGQWFKARGDNKRKLKIILFNLLETYFFLFRSDLKRILAKVSEKIIPLVPESERTKENMAMLNKIFSSLIEQVIMPLLKEQLSTVKKNYNEAVNSLAEIDPVNAYYMNGRTELIDYFDSVHLWVSDIEKLTPTDSEDIKFKTQSVLEQIKPNILNGVMSDLSRDIRKIAWRISPIVWLNSKEAMRYMQKSAQNQIDKEIDKTLEQIKSLAASA